VWNSLPAELRLERLTLLLSFCFNAVGLIFSSFYCDYCNTLLCSILAYIHYATLDVSNASKLLHLSSSVLCPVSRAKPAFLGQMLIFLRRSQQLKTNKNICLYLLKGKTEFIPSSRSSEIKCPKSGFYSLIMGEVNGAKQNTSE